VCAYIRGEEGAGRIRELIEASFDPVFSIDEEGVIQMANGAACELFGWEMGDFLGSNISMICGGDYAEHHTQYIHRYLKTGKTKIMGKQREVSAKKKDGTEFPVVLGIKEISTNSGHYFAAYIRDMTAQKHHEQEMRFRASLTQGLVNSSFDPMFQIDHTGTIQVVNQSAVDMFGWTTQEFLGSNISMICGGEHAQQHNKYIARYLSTGQKRIIGTKRKTTARRKDGSEFDIELGIQEVQSSTGERMFCGYVRDLTQQILDKRRIRHNEAIIHDKFFHVDNDNADNADDTEVTKTPARLRRYRHSPSI